MIDQDREVTIVPQFLSTAPMKLFPMYSGRLNSLHTVQLLVMTAGAMVIAGCFGPAFQCGEARPLEIRISNYTNSEINVNVLVENNENLTIFSRQYGIGAHGNVSTGVIASLVGNYPATVTVDQNRTASNVLIVGGCHFGADALVFDDRVELGQAVP